MGPPQSCGWHTIYHRNCNSDSLTSISGLPELLEFAGSRLTRGPEVKPPKTGFRSSAGIGVTLAAEKIGGDLLAGIDQALHRADRFVEGLAVLAGELDLDDALNALGADHDGDADIHVLHAVFALEVGGRGQHALLVTQIALGHRDRGRRRRIEGQTGL